ncbi:hypothetical protein D3Z38_02785 [Clostridiales bacterium]|nr:hypothetical protein [Clostridiales bacterium]
MQRTRKKHRILWLAIAFLMAVTVVPLIQGRGITHAAAIRQAARIELVNLPEKREFYVGLDEADLAEQLRVKVIFCDGSEQIMGVSDYLEVDGKRNVSAYTTIGCSTNQDGSYELIEGNNRITVKYEESRYYQGEKIEMQTLEESFDVKGIAFTGYNPDLENNQDLESQVSNWGNEILFSNGELWKAPSQSIRYAQKSNIQGIAEEAYHSIYLDQNHSLSVESMIDGAVYETFDNVKDFGADYVLQKDGTLKYLQTYYVWKETHNRLKWKPVIAGTNIEQCVSVDGGGFDGYIEKIHYVLDKTGKLYRHNHIYEKSDIEKIAIDEEQDIIQIVPTGDDSVYYLTENGTVKYWEYQDSSESPRIQVIMENAERILGGFAIGTDGASYRMKRTIDSYEDEDTELEMEGTDQNAQALCDKALDTEIVDCQIMYDDSQYVADNQGNLYLDTGGDMMLVASDFEKFSNYGYKTTSGEKERLVKGDAKGYLGDGWDWKLGKEETVYLSYSQGARQGMRERDYKLLTNVVDAGTLPGGNTLIMGRKDGTVWLFDLCGPCEMTAERNRIATPRKVSAKMLDDVYNVTSAVKKIEDLVVDYQREMSFTGKEIRPTVTIRDGDYVLKQGTDYDLTYQNNVNPGRAVITITGKGGYTGQKALSFTIKKAQAASKKNQALQGANAFVKAYGSKPFYLRIKTTGDGKLSYKSSNQKIAAVDNAGKVTLKGSGKTIITVTAKATKNYNMAVKRISLTVNPKRVVGLKAKAGNKKMSVTWKQDVKASGYQLTYAKNSKFTKGKKNVMVKKNKTTKHVVKKLKPKKTYYVKVRAYKKVGNAKLHGAYSKVKKVRI